MEPRVKVTGTHAQVSWSKAHREMVEALYALGIDEYRVECESPPARYESYQATRDQARVTLHYVDDGRPVALTVEAGRRPVDNLRAIGLALESRRLNIVRGIDAAVRATYLALPPPPKERDPYEVLGVRPDAPLEVIEASYKALARSRHPDAGGSDAAFIDLTSAWEQVRAARGVA